MNSEFWSFCILALAAALLGSALFLEHVMGEQPCPLCMMQRIWVMLIGLIACISIAHNPRLRIYPLLTALAACIGAGFSLRQLWLQSLPADQVPACGPGLDYMLDAFPLSEVLKAMTSGTGDCAQIHPFLGLPLPLWSLGGFLVFLVLAVLQWRSAARV